VIDLLREYEAMDEQEKAGVRCRLHIAAQDFEVGSLLPGNTPAAKWIIRLWEQLAGKQHPHNRDRRGGCE
jgi:hypothetical protein